VSLETNQSEVIRQYLLGLAPEAELSALDERLVTDGDFYEELLIVESELTDQYLSGELSPAERAGFEKHFLISAERRQQLRFARSFQSYLSEKAPELDPKPSAAEVSDEDADVPKPPPKRRPWYHGFLPAQNPAFASAAMFAVLLAVGGVVWLALKNRAPEEVGPIFAVTIVAGTTRGIEDGAAKISIPPDSGTVEMKAQLAREDYGSYRAVCLDENSSEVSRSENLQPIADAETRYLPVRIPARLLKPGIYSLRISGKQPDGGFEDLPIYRFQIQR
jgi:hypothetical protein